MKQTPVATIMTTALLLLALTTLVRADSPPPALRSALTSGGGTISVSGYQLTGAIGQPLAGPVATQGQYALTSGLFGGPIKTSDRGVYVSLIRR